MYTHTHIHTQNQQKLKEAFANSPFLARKLPTCYMLLTDEVDESQHITNLMQVRCPPRPSLIVLCTYRCACVSVCLSVRLSVCVFGSLPAFGCILWRFLPPPVHLLCADQTVTRAAVEQRMSNDFGAQNCFHVALTKGEGLPPPQRAAHILARRCSTTLQNKHKQLSLLSTPLSLSTSLCQTRPQRESRA